MTYCVRKKNHPVVLGREIEFRFIFLTEFGLVSADAEHSLRIGLVVNAHVTVRIEEESDLVTSEFPVRLAHDDVVGPGPEIRGRTGAIGYRFSPNELTVQNGDHVLVGLNHLNLVASFSVNDFVVEHFAPQNYIHEKSQVNDIFKENQHIKIKLKITEFAQTEMFLAVDRFPTGSVDGTGGLMARPVIKSAPDGS